MSQLLVSCSARRQNWISGIFGAAKTCSSAAQIFTERIDVLEQNAQRLQRTSCSDMKIKFQNLPSR